MSQVSVVVEALDSGRGANSERAVDLVGALGFEVARSDQESGGGEGHEGQDEEDDLKAITQPVHEPKSPRVKSKRKDLPISSFSNL